MYKQCHRNTYNIIHVRFAYGSMWGYYSGGSEIAKRRSGISIYLSVVAAHVDGYHIRSAGGYVRLLRLRLILS